jgi:hypothetical protein
VLFVPRVGIRRRGLPLARIPEAAPPRPVGVMGGKGDS